MAWGSETAATQRTSVTTEVDFQFAGDENITLNPRERAHVEVDVDFPTTPTDNALVSVYGSIDGGTDYDDTPIMQIVVDNGTDPNQVSFVVEGIYSFKITVQRDGSTDTITSADCRYRKDGVSA